MPGTSTTRIAAGVTFFACTTSASASSRSSAIRAMPTFDLSATDAYAVTSAPAFVSALNSVVLPAFGRPTIPISRRHALEPTPLPKPTRLSRAKRLK